MPDRPMAFERRRARRLPLRVIFPLVVLIAVLGGTCSAAGDVVKLNAPLVLGGRVSSFAVSPDGGRVVYRADQATDNVIELSHEATSRRTRAPACPLPRSARADLPSL